MYSPSGLTFAKSKTLTAGEPKLLCKGEQFVRAEFRKTLGVKVMRTTMKHKIASSKVVRTIMKPKHSSLFIFVCHLKFIPTKTPEGKSSHRVSGDMSYVTFDVSPASTLEME